MSRFTLACLTLVLFAFPPLARPQVSIGAAVNAASFLNADLPNGKLTQGGMFTGFGVGMGPADLVRVSAFPLPTSLAGTSVQAAVGGVSVDCIMIFTRADQLAAILPSKTPVGAGTLTVSFNGQTSPTLAIEVVAHGFGAFTINQSGAGPGVFTDPIAAGQPANTLFESAAPGSL